MGIFDIFKKQEEKPKQEYPVKTSVQDQNTSANQPSSSLIEYYASQNIPSDIRSLLWFADGPLKNFSPDNEEISYNLNDTIRITFTISFNEEPSVVYSGLPIDFESKTDPNESIGYFPSYKKLTPKQRYNYLNWLCDIRKPVDIGYVFIFYYGLERHLIYGNFLESFEMILKLRQYHKHSSFLHYSAGALIASSMLHKDRQMLEKSIASVDDSSIHIDLITLAKYLLKYDLNPDEIIMLKGISGFKKTNYMNEYPEIFREYVSQLLTKEFGHNSFPFFNLDLHPPEKSTIMFANVSLSDDIRSPKLPSIVDDSNFKDSINKILSATHENVKQYLSEQKKLGNKIIPKSEIIDENAPKVNCPYCDIVLQKPPKAKKKCPNCGQFIHVKSTPTDRVRRLVREDQLPEIEKQWTQYFRTKKIQDYLKYNDISHLKYDQVKKDLELKNNAEPSEKDIILELVNIKSIEDANNMDMGLFRNDLLTKGDFLISFDDLNKGLISYLQVIYLDINRPFNCGCSKDDPYLMKEFPLFRPTEDWKTDIVPGIIVTAKDLCQKLGLLADKIKSLFISHNAILSKTLNPPISPEKAWEILEDVIVSNGLDEIIKPKTE